MRLAMSTSESFADASSGGHNPSARPPTAPDSSSEKAQLSSTGLPMNACQPVNRSSQECLVRAQRGAGIAAMQNFQKEAYAALRSDEMTPLTQNR
jgi:hypothetical protein